MKIGYMYYDFMSSCMIQIFSNRTKIALLCLVSVFVLFPALPISAQNYETAKVYLTTQGPVPGESGDFWQGLTGTVVDRRPWIGTAEDASGVFYLAADPKNLYIRAEIKDAAPQLRPTSMDAGQAWNGTSLQVFFGTITKRHSEYGEGDSGISMWVVQGNDGKPKVMVAKGRLLNDRQYRAAVVEWNRNSYIIEVSISLDALSIYKPLKDKQKIRCEFRINHAKQGEDRSVIVNWRTPGDEAWKDPNTWSDGVVVKK